MSDNPKNIINIQENVINTFTPTFRNNGDVFINSDKEFFDRLGEIPKIDKKIFFEIRNPISSFIGREEELQQLFSLVAENKIIVITGMVGVGKTEISKKYAFDYQNCYDDVIWINMDTMEESIYKLAIEMNISVENHGQRRLIGSIMEDIYKKYLDKKCLIIFDDIIDRSTIKHCLPSKKIKNDNIHVIITSKNIEWGRVFCLKLSSLSQLQSINLVKQLLKKHCDIDREKNNINKLVEILQYHPLALQQAIAYITDRIIYEKDFKIKTYLHKLETDFSFLNYCYNDKPFPEYSEHTYTKTIYEAIIFDVENIKCPLAYKTIHTASYLSSKNISKNIFLTLAELEDELYSAIRILLKNSLITDDGNLNIHALIQKSICYKLKISSDISYLQLALNLVLCDEYKQTDHSCCAIKEAQKINYINDFYQETSKRIHLLHAIAFHGNIYALKDIHDPNIYTQQDTVFDMISAATKNGHLPIVSHFFNKGLSMNCQNKSGWSYLHEASCNNQLQLCKIYVMNGVNVDIKTNDGWTPLHFAAEGGFFEIIEYLVQNSADVNIVNCDGQTALSLARNSDVINILNTAMTEAVLIGSCYCFRKA